MQIRRTPTFNIAGEKYLHASSRVGEMVEVLFANVTNWSAKARDFMVNEDSVSVFLGVETHWASGKEALNIKNIYDAGWVPSYARAVPSATSLLGNNGGVVASRRSDIRGTHLETDVWENSVQVWRSPFPHLAGQQVRLRGLDVLFLGGTTEGAWSKTSWQTLGG